MTAVFSGGCVYELWQGPNAYGLAMFKHKNPTRRMGRIKAGRVAERRECEGGTLLLFEDLFNLKGRLVGVGGLMAGVDDDADDIGEGSEAVGPSASEGGVHTIEGEVPGSCVDWLAVEQGLRSGAQAT
jgi:hypothetical protein